jgi:hypothetical protein
MREEYEILEIDSIEEVGEFEDEYVYDLEMEDESHTFIGNDILVHNTDSIFVGFEPAIKSCDWRNRVFNERWLNNCTYPYMILTENELDIEINNSDFRGYINYDHHLKEFKLNGELIKECPTDFKILLIDGSLVKSWDLPDFIKNFNGKIIYNWAHELEFIHGLDKFRIEDYFKQMLNEHAASYGVENVEDFELEKIAESVINLEKKKYIQHITWEDGIDYERFSYYQPKGVELVRSSTPQFARDKEMGIYRVVKYLFKHPDDFNIKELVGIVKEMRREFEMADINDISGQSSCSKYDEKVLNDKDSLEFVTGAHFAVKAAAYFNFLLHQNKELQTKYEFLKSGDKIKYYYTDEPQFPIFAFKRGEYPIEFAPNVDYDTQFEKVILSPINSIIKKLGMPEINKRLSVIMDIFSGF